MKNYAQMAKLKKGTSSLLARGSTVTFSRKQFAGIYQNLKFEKFCPGIYPKFKNWKYACTVIVVVKNWKARKCSSVEKWLNRSYIQRIPCNS